MQKLNTEVKILLIVLDPDNRKLLASQHQVDITVFLTTAGKELTMGNLGTLLDKSTTSIGKP